MSRVGNLGGKHVMLHINAELGAGCDGCVFNIPNEATCDILEENVECSEHLTGAIWVEIETLVKYKRRKL